MFVCFCFVFYQTYQVAVSFCGWGLFDIGLFAVVIVGGILETTNLAQINACACTNEGSAVGSEPNEVKLSHSFSPV